MTHPHNKINQLVTHQELTIRCNLHTLISCKFLSRFTHKLQSVTFSGKSISHSTFPRSISNTLTVKFSERLSTIFIPFKKLEVRK